MVKDPHWPRILGYKPIDLGLVRIKKMMKEIGNPHLKLPPVVHFAGTNGKGSTIAFMRAVLEDAGYKVHVYTSPHLVEFNERIVLAGKPITDKFLYRVLEESRIASQWIPLTFFEATTGAAFLAFSKVKADIVLLETGVGGRLDATNIIPQPLATVITSISMDHTEYLGNTITKIAREKAAIIKKNCPCITTSVQPAAAMRVIKNKAKKEKGKLIIAPKSIKYDTGLIGEFQKQNAALAVAALKNLDGFKITEKNIRNGLRKAEWFARMQHISKGKLARLLPKGSELWLDGGHNEGAARELVKNIKKWRDKKLYIIFGMLNKKDCRDVLEILPPKAFSGLYGVSIPDEAQSYTAEEVADKAVALGFAAKPAKNVSQAIKEIAKRENKKFRILIFGSLYLAGSVLAENQ